MKELSYEKFVFAINKIAERAKNFNINSVYGIPTGGLVPAVYVGHLLNVPVVEENYIGKETLIIDDICDTGKTLGAYNHFGYNTATIYYHKQSIVEPDIWIYEKRNEWIKFPWETNKTAKNHLEK